MTKVKCEIEDCSFNNNGECGRDEVEIGWQMFSASSPYCKSFTWREVER